MSVRGLAVLLGLVLLVGIVSSSTRPAYAETFTCVPSIDGSQEVPPVDTEGSGLAVITFDSETNDLSWEIEFSGLSGNATAAHFHGPAASGTNAGVQINIGDVSGLTSPMVGSAVLTAEQASYLLDGEMYINIHTEANPNGEIRGQVSCESEPPTNGQNGEQWQVATLTMGGNEFDVQYMIVNGTLNELTGDAGNKIITALITAEQDGELAIQLPREIIDSVANGQDLDYIVFVDEIQEFVEDDFGTDVRTLTIPFLQQSRTIDIVGTIPPPVQLPSANQTVSVAGEDIEVPVRSSSTISEFQLDEDSRRLSFAVDSQDGTEGTTEITIGRILEGPYTMTIDGEETTNFEVTGTGSNTRIIVSYAPGAQEITITGTTVVPEFPVAAIILGVAIVGIIVATARYGKFSFLPKT